MSATTRMPPPDVWGVGRVVVGGEALPWPVSAADVEDETTSQSRALARLGVREGDVVVLCSLLSQAIHVFPLEQAVNALGARYSSTDATEFDAFRTAAMIRQVEPRAVIGVNGAVVSGLRELGRELRDVFASVPVVVAADADAWRALRDAGLAPFRWRMLGPTSVFECEVRDGLHVDATRWRVERGDAGALLLTSLTPRLTACDRFVTGVRGDVVLEPCACGSDEPRVRAEEAVDG
ncbi:MAG TPA: hypothetical protein VFC33_19605 [Acidimicrobiia bacterium]|nr:hypothetical protein [Acidimicrobiia bacterium]